MDSPWITRTIRSLGVAALLCSIGAVAWVVGTMRREAATRVVWAPLWPRADGSVRSFGEVWDHPEPSEMAAG
jgi:hypothetical protein